MKNLHLLLFFLLTITLFFLSQYYKKNNTLRGLSIISAVGLVIVSFMNLRYNNNNNSSEYMWISPDSTRIKISITEK